MTNFAHPTWIEIDLSQFKKNIVNIRKLIGNRLYCLPVKANAYGHGLVEVAKAAIEARVDYLGVSCLKEGALLREAKIDLPILVMGAIHEDQIEELIRYNLEFSISSKYKADLVAKRCKLTNKRCSIHIEVDSGMHRTGVRCSGAMELYNYLKSLNYFEIVGVYSHFAKGDDPHDAFSSKQIHDFKELIRQFKQDESNMIFHLANSGGVLYFSDAYFDMVRPGILSFGVLQNQIHPILEDLASFFTLKARISYFKVISKGGGISYGHIFITGKQTRIVTIPLGYGDGFRRALSNKGSVLIRGKRYPIVGNICMDQFMVDIGSDEAYVGDEVVLIGRQGDNEITVQEVATLCDTIPHEILCAFNERIPRFY